MDSKSVPILLVTANVGSIFEDPNVMLKIWTDEFLATVAKLAPKFIALHCQEVGGKNYEKSMNYVEDFIQLLVESDELKLFTKVKGFIDEDYSSAENFTALGNLYFVHESLREVLIWDFKEQQFLDVEGTEIHSGNIEGVVTKEKAKFPQDFFPECKWSRKGFLRTRWSINGTVFDLINIHLFHDASNFIAMESFPSVYSRNRRRALEHTLQRFHNDRHGKAPFFLFGDFNFRTDTEGVVKQLTEGLRTSRTTHYKGNDYSKMNFHDNDDHLMLTVGKKEFKHIDHQNVFLNRDGQWLQSFDRELEAFEEQLYEYPVRFPPSYPFEEKVSYPTSYMQTRCPAWCDRVLLSITAQALIDDIEPVQYNIIGLDTCMGDHKPVYLRVNLRPESGIVRCCQHNLQDVYAACHCCQTYASIKIEIVESDVVGGRNSFIDVDYSLLHEPFTKEMLLHDPYTPESAESHSPLPEDKRELAEIVTLRKTSVSPRILKSRLENILRSKKDLRDESLSIDSEKSDFEVSNFKPEKVEIRNARKFELGGKVSDFTFDSEEVGSEVTEVSKFSFDFDSQSLVRCQSHDLDKNSRINCSKCGSKNNLANFDFCKCEINGNQNFSSKKLFRSQSQNVSQGYCNECMNLQSNDRINSQTSSQNLNKTLGSQISLEQLDKNSHLSKTTLEKLDNKWVFKSQSNNLGTKTKCPHSQLNNTDTNHPIQTCTCFLKTQSQNFDFNLKSYNRPRAFTEITRNTKKPLKNSRVRLISTASAQSIHRLQSHHSSSDEDWFEFEDLDDDVIKETNSSQVDNVVTDVGTQITDITDCEVKSAKSESVETQQKNADLNTDIVDSEKVSQNSHKNIRNKKKKCKACCCIS